MIKKKIFVFFLVLFSCSFIFAQKKSVKRIYVLDWTKTMDSWKNPRTGKVYPDVWKDLKPILIDNLKQIDESTTDVVLLCFDSKIKHRFTSISSILSFLNDSKNKPEGMNTNLSLPWREALKEVDQSKYNFITFLTDGGEQNVSGEIPFDECITSKDFNSWDDLTSKFDDIYMCFVRLTDDALDPKVISALRQYDNISILDGIRFPSIITLAKLRPNYNIRELSDQKVIIPATIINKPELNPNMAFIVESSNPTLVDVSKVSFDLEKEELSFYLSRKISLKDCDSHPDDISININVKPKDQVFTIIPNSELSFNFKNVKERNATVNVELKEKESRYYSSFLLSKESNEPIKVDMKSIKGAFAPSNASVKAAVKLNNASGKITPDLYGLSLNGTVISQKDFNLDLSGRNQELSVYFNPSLSSGKYELEIHLIGANLDAIYPQDRISFNKIEYTKGMNPVLLGLIILLVLLVTMLLLWKFVIIYLAYPRIKKFNTLIINSEQDIASKKIRGARMVCLTNKNKKQSFINRFFTGKVLYIQQSIWMDGDVNITPKFTNRPPYKLTVANGHKYGSPRFIEKGLEYNLRNKSNQKINITII